MNIFKENYQKNLANNIVFHDNASAMTESVYLHGLAQRTEVIQNFVQKMRQKGWHFGAMWRRHIYYVV